MNLVSKEWLFRLDGVESGPYTWPEVRRRVQTGEITRRHEVRLGRDGHIGQWLPISRMGHLLPAFPPELQARPVSSVQQNLTEPNSGANDKSAERPSSFLGGAALRWELSFQSLIDIAMGFWYLLQGLGAGFVGLLYRFAIQIAVVVGFLGLNAGLVYWESIDSENEQVQKVMTIGNRYQDLRAGKPTDAEWSAFASESLATLEPMQKSLKRYASNKRPIQQKLFFAVRDGVIPMLKKTHGDVDSEERTYRSHLRQIARLQNPDSLELRREFDTPVKLSVVK